MPDQEAHWNSLHQNPRFRPSYPSDHVVRFLKASQAIMKKNDGARFLDIGVGAGRHAKLAAELSFISFGVDFSETGLRHACARLQKSNVQFHLARASMLTLPFKDESFDIALSYGVFYYGTAAEMKQAIRETHRVLGPQGRAFVVLRTTGDSRFNKGVQIDPQTFRLTISETNELGTVQHFLAAEDILSYFSQFSRVSFEKSETTSDNRQFVDSDWLITAEK